MSSSKEGFRLDLREIVQIGLENFALQGQVGELAFALDRNQAGYFQFLDVMGESGSAHGLAFADIGAGGGAAFCADLFEDFQTARVCQGFGNQMELTFGKHFAFGHLYQYGL
jgi:hypothetical protein